MTLLETRELPESVFRSKTEDMDLMTVALMLSSYNGCVVTELVMDIERGVRSAAPEQSCREAYQRFNQSLRDTRSSGDPADYL